MSSQSDQLVSNSKARPEFCYLCGQQLRPPTDRDHIPPKRFFAPSLRKKHNLSKLLTAEVHKECNKSYQSDEEYSVYTLLGSMRGSYVDNELYNHILAKYRPGEGIALVKKVLFAICYFLLLAPYCTGGTFARRRGSNILPQLSLYG